jgi:hypothetical protein
VLTLLLASVAARRWSEPPPGGAAGGESWRRDEDRYYHERRLLPLLLGGVALTQWVIAGLDIVRLSAFSLFGQTSPWLVVASLVESPVLCLAIVACSVPLLGAWGFALRLWLG